jgi:poly(A) polymerase
MPIITPAYPSMCATHNITHSTKAIILRELVRAGEIANSIAAGKKTWNDLFHKHTFFTEGYKYFLSIVSASRTKEAQQIWSGLVQSKVRRLVSGIEMSDTGVELAHPFNKGFDRVHQCSNEDEVDMVFQGDLRFQVYGEKLDQANTADDVNMVTETNGTPNGTPNDTTGAANGDGVQMTVYTTTYYVGLELGVADCMSSSPISKILLTNI